ncbi:MAG: hypothetical protein NE328_05780 [Lentisphaeraceae bacterium]|nr:hypothetical protein [Lentisphaeraceae bacterium]
MKKRLPALFLAVGMTAAPMFAKQTNRKSESNSSPKIEDNKKDRIANSVKRQKLLKAEKELIKETEKAIADALTKKQQTVQIKKYKSFERDKSLRVVMKDQMPTNGIDISDQFRIIHKSETS